MQKFKLQIWQRVWIEENPKEAKELGFSENRL